MTKLNRPLQIFFWSFAFIYVVSCSLQITQVDLWWQLSEGEHILSTWKLPTGPAAAFGLPANPYFDEYAGYEIVLALAYKIGGFPGLWLIFIAVYLAVMFLPIATSKEKFPAFDFSSTAAMLFSGILMRERLEQRPELVAGLLLVLLMVILRKTHLEKIPATTLVALFFLFFAWTNTHSTFVIGLFTLELWMACELARKFRKAPFATMLRNGAALTGVALIATTLNPYGPKRLLFPFLQAFDPGSTALSVEMWPISDLTTLAAILVLIEVALLAWGILSNRGVPLWIILFSLFSVCVSFKSFRFINLLAISVLFVYAGRADSVITRKSEKVMLTLLKDVVLCLLCVFFIYGDAYSFFFTYQEMRAENRLAVHTRRFAPEISALPQFPRGDRLPVLCGHGIGSYLSLEGNSPFRPLLDSGLSHFSSDTKRYFFFLLLEPHALALVLQDLRVNYILINRDTFPWVSTIQRLPDWEFVTCNTQGLLLKRNPGGPHPLSDSDRGLISQTAQEMEDNGEIVGAFDYSTLLGEPSRSLDIIEHYQGPAWSESMFNYFNAWVESLPPTLVETYLAGNHPRHYPLVDAILSARLGPDVFAKFMATHPPGPRPWFWKVLEIRAALQKGNASEARAIFDTISPIPTASVIYYEIWHQVHDDPASLSAYGRWQSWDDEAQQLVKSMSVQLNDRMTELDQQPGS